GLPSQGPLERLSRCSDPAFQSLVLECRQSGPAGGCREAGRPGAAATLDWGQVCQEGVAPEEYAAGRDFVLRPGSLTDLRSLFPFSMLVGITTEAECLSRAAGFLMPLRRGPELLPHRRPEQPPHRRPKPLPRYHPELFRE